MVATRRRIAAITWLALALQLGLSLPAFAGLVLCVGNDGHVAVENGGCARQSEGSASRCGEFSESDVCTDTPLVACALASESSPRSGASPAAAALASFSVLASSVVIAARPGAAAPADARRGHRSSILRL
jgi:hypothetical protein